MDSLWGILKKINYQIFDILIFRDFFDPEKRKIGKKRQKQRFLDFTGPKIAKNQNIKNLIDEFFKTIS